MQVVVVGGGLAGLSAAHTALERGARVVVLDKNPFCGGNSTKATSGRSECQMIFFFFLLIITKGINGSGTLTQRKKGIQG
jgi:uncharacterized protein with NAD-binding domain and iron-sulfur cluster